MWALVACLGFVVIGSVLIPYPGIEDDESLFANPIYGPVVRAYRMRVFHHDIPLMVMDYIGGLKSWLYSPIFRFVKPSPASVRVPVLLIGALTVWLFYRLLDRVAGRRAAFAGCFLLATDSIFLLTTEFDWGPVAIQHLMLVSGCLLLVRFHQTGSWKPLLGGFFALGLGLWDKALFGWLLGGLGVAAVVVFPKEIFRRLTARHVEIAVAGFLLGCWPLVVFNVRHDWQTFRNNAAFSAEGLAGKAWVLRFTLDGQGLFGYIVNERSAQPVREPGSWLEKASTRIAGLAGNRQENFMLEALAIALLAGLLLRGQRRAILFALVFLTVAWTQMAFTRNAGGGVHHSVLLFPFPQFVVAVALAEVSRRLGKWGLAALIPAVTFLCLANLVVTNQYLAQLIRNGTTVTWTDAIYPLSASLKESEVHDVFAMDWGFFDTLQMLHEGRIELHGGSDPVMKDAPNEADQRAIDNMLSQQHAVFITHMPGQEFFPGAMERLLKAAAERGYRGELLRTVADRNGRPVFKVYRFVRD